MFFFLRGKRENSTPRKTFQNVGPYVGPFSFQLIKKIDGIFVFCFNTSRSCLMGGLLGGVRDCGREARSVKSLPLTGKDAYKIPETNATR